MGVQKEIAVLRTPISLNQDQEDDTLAKTLRKKGSTYFTFSGRFYPYKGIKETLEAVPMMLSRDKDLHLVCVGEDIPHPDVGFMQTYFQQTYPELVNHVSFIGKLSHQQLNPLIRQAELCVLPSKVDNFPNACLEAMALGTPVLGTKQGMGEMIEDGLNGFLIKEVSPHHIAQKVKDALRDEEKLKEIGRKAQGVLQSYGTDQAAQSLIAYYQQVNTSSSWSCAWHKWKGWIEFFWRMYGLWFTFKIFKNVKGKKVSCLVNHALFICITA